MVLTLREEDVLFQQRNDHRIAMSMLIFGLASDKDVLIDDPSMIKTSFLILKIFSIKLMLK